MERRDSSRADALTTVSLFALFMKISWTTAAATQFTLYMMILNIGYACGPMLTRLGLDYTQTYLLCAGLAIMPLAVLPLLDPESVVRRKQSETYDVLPHSGHRSLS